MFVPPIGLWIATSAMGAKRQQERLDYLKKRKPDIDMGVAPIRKRPRMRMCIKAQSDNPCHSAIECGHGEPHICNGNDCLEIGHYCASIKHTDKENA